MTGQYFVYVLYDPTTMHGLTPKFFTFSDVDDDDDDDDGDGGNDDNDGQWSYVLHFS